MKNPGSLNSISGTPTLLRARARLPRAEGPGHELPSSSPGGKATRRGPPEPRRPPGPCSLATRSLPARSAKVHGEARPQHRPRRGVPRPQPRTPPTTALPALPLERSAHPASRGPAVHAAPQPARAQPPARNAPSSTLLARGLWGPAGRAGSPRALTCTAQSMGVAGRAGREVSVTPRAGRAGVRPGACPRSHLPPSRESPRAGPRARQCARAALPSTAGGGGGGGGPGGGARRCPQAAPRPVRLGALRPQLRPALASEGVGRGEGPPGAPWAGAGSFRGRPSSEPQWRAGDLLNLPGPIARARPRAGRAGDTCPEAGPRPRGLKPSV